MLNKIAYWVSVIFFVINALCLYFCWKTPELSQLMPLFWMNMALFTIGGVANYHLSKRPPPVE